MITSALLSVLLSASPAAAPAPTPAPSEKMTCKRFAETGSLVKKRRVCRTKAEWARLSARTQEEWGELQGTKGSSRGN